MAKQTYSTVDESELLLSVNRGELLLSVNRGQQPYLPPDYEEPEEPKIPPKAKKPKDGLTEIQRERENHTATEPENYSEVDFQPGPEVRQTKEKTDKIPKNRKPVERLGEKDYDEVFLARTQSVQRCQTYIDRVTYSLIKSFLPVIAPDISISAYINNVLGDHLDEYWDTINEKYNSAVAKPLARR